jgi:cytochrome c553
MPYALSIGLALWGLVAVADESAGGAQLFTRECAGCHGSRAEGGNDGEHPRLAGLPQGYLVAQLDGFRSGKRQNKPMLPVFEGGRLSESEVQSVAAWLAALTPPAPAEVGIPDEIEGDLELGQELYEKDCLLCHGPDGRGKPETDNPQLVAQYPRYLEKQIADFRTGARWHEYGEALFGEAYEDELEAVLAYVLTLNHGPPTSTE